MAKFFIDTEFHEYQKSVKILGITIKKVWTIDLISIGIVSEDSREYYAINRGFDMKHAKKNEWLKVHVLDELPPKQPLYPPHGSPRIYQESMRWLPMKQIASEIVDFVNNNRRFGEPIEFYGYYADYDWVVFCWIFGKMMDLPKGFPMYCKDLKQMMDDNGLDKDWKRRHCPDPEGEHNALVDAKWNKELYDKINL